MDRFPERRFAGFDLATLDARPGDERVFLRNDLLFSPIFTQVSPPVMRFVADERGRILARDVESSGFAGRVESDPMDHGWRAVLEPADRRTLAKAAAGSPRPAPVPVRMHCTDGSVRWCLVRMVRVAAARGSHRWYGTVEDIHDRSDPELDALEAALRESRQHYRASVELNPQVPWTAGPDGAIEEVGPRWAALTGIDTDAALGVGWMDSLHPDDAERVSGIWADHLQSGLPVDVDYRVRLKDGSYRWMRARAAARRDDRGAIIRWYGSLEDVHAQRLAQQALSESEERFRLAVQSAQLGIWDFDAVTGIRTWSPELRAMLGLADDVPATSELALSLVHPDDRAELQGMMSAVACNSLPPHFEATLRIHRADDGRLRWIRSTGWSSRLDGERPLRLIVTFLDVTEEREAEVRIRWAATHDPMTRIPNRTFWQEGLEAMARQARADRQGFGLMLLDIDDLKRTNDALGHDAGDALLGEFVARLRNVVPADALIGRLGGDEFGLIAPSLATRSALEQCAARLIEAMREPHVHDGRTFACGVSIGAALFGEHGGEADELLKAADLALYASKAAGRGRLTLFHPALRAEAQRRTSMIHMARDAVARDMVVPHYQPKVDLVTGRVLGYEALLRWRHPSLGILPPASIAAAFEDGELAAALTGRMLDAVTADLRGWLDGGIDPGRIAVNAAAADFQCGDFAERVLERLARCDLPPERLEIEVTETVFLGRGAHHVERALDVFARAGVRIALDDFGTGYASLTHLKQYPVDVIKIDRSFVSHIEEDAGDAAIVDAIVKLGTSLGLEVVAEGVETEGQAALLIGHGCSVGQGFLLGRPQPASMLFPDMAEPKTLSR